MDCKMSFELDNNNTFAITERYVDSFTITPKDKFRAVINPDGKVSEIINNEIELAGVIVQTVAWRSEDGESRDTPRITLITKSGKSYSASSFTLFSQLQVMFGTVLADGWPAPIKLKVLQHQRSNKRYFALELIG